MKKLIVNLSGDRYQQYKGHREAISDLLVKVALFNQIGGGTIDKFSQSLCVSDPLAYELSPDGSVIMFGDMKWKDRKKSFVIYGSIHSSTI